MGPGVGGGGGYITTPFLPVACCCSVAMVDWNPVDREHTSLGLASW